VCRLFFPGAATVKSCNCHFFQNPCLSDHVLRLQVPLKGLIEARKIEIIRLRVLSGRRLERVVMLSLITGFKGMRVGVAEGQDYLCKTKVSRQINTRAARLTLSIESVR
jgi:hypothetical protein